MIKQILEHARPAMQLSIAVFFLVTSGWVVRLYWIEEPIQALGQRLLAKDGALLIKNLSDERTIGSLRKLTAPSSKAPPRSGPLHHLIDRMTAKDGALLKAVSATLLQQPTIQKLLLRPSSSSKAQGEPPLVRLGRYAIDKLLAQDAKLANKLTLDILAQLVPKRPRSKAQAVPDSWAMIERLGRHAIAKLFAQKAALGLHVTKEIIASQTRKGPKASKSPPFDAQALVKGLGEHAIDRLTASRAQPLRAILQSLLGPEPMRALRSLRQVVQRLSHQLRRLHIGQLARESAYQLGRGGLEAFLKQQQANRQREARAQRKLQARRRQARKALRAAAPCFVPRGDAWLAYRKGAVTASLHLLHQRPSCRPHACRAQRSKARALLWKMSRDLLKDPADLVLQLTPSCDPPPPTTPRRPTTSPKNRRTRPPTRRPPTRPRARRAAPPKPTIPPRR